MEDNTQKISKYSSGVNILMRIDALWKDTHLHSRYGKYMMWNLDLDRIWLELSRDLDESNKKYSEKEKEFDDLDKKLNKLMPFNDNLPSGFREQTKEEIKKRNEIYKILMEKQQFLARLENELGKGTTFNDDDDDDFD